MNAVRSPRLAAAAPDLRGARAEAARGAVREAPHAAARPGGAAFGAGSGVRYGALGLPLAFLALPLYVVLPNHYAQQFGVPLATLGAVLLATRALDAFVDPLIGDAVDRLFARSAAVALAAAAAAAVVVGIGFAGLFFPPPPIAAPAGNGLLAWLGVEPDADLPRIQRADDDPPGVGRGSAATRRSARASSPGAEGFGLVGVLTASVVPALFGMGAASAVLAVALAAGVVLLACAPRAPQLLSRACGDRGCRGATRDFARCSSSSC